MLHEARGGPARELVDAELVALGEGVDPPVLVDQVLVDRRARERVEVADDDEAVAASLALDEAHQVAGLLELVGAPAQAARLGPELARQGAGKAQVRVEHVDGRQVARAPLPGTIGRKRTCAQMRVCLNPFTGARDG